MKATLLIVLALLFSFNTFSQIDSIRSETILKIEKPDYRKAQLKWLNKEGFDTESYGWDDLYINSSVDMSLKQRNWGDVIGVTGGSLILINVLKNFIFGPLVHSLSDEGGKYQPSNDLYLVGGAMVGGSLYLHIKSKSNLEKAKKRRKNRNK